MACPCFDPTGPVDWSAWSGRFRPPLGRPHSGICRAHIERPAVPEEAVLLNCCNLGYARGRCERLPSEAADAVRFSLGSIGEVRWTLETDHRPVAAGVCGAGLPSGRGRVLDRQIEAFRTALCDSPDS